MEEMYLTYLLLAPTKGMDGIVENNEELLNVAYHIDSHYLMRVVVSKKGNKFTVLGTNEDFNIVYNNETPIKFIKKGLNLVYPTIRIDNIYNGSKIICDHLKIGLDEITKSIDKFYFDGMAYYSKNKREKEKTLRINK